MTWTYDENLGTAMDKVRALVGDIDDNNELIQNELILVFLAETSQNIYKAASMACAAIIQVLTSKGAVTIGPLSVDYGAQARALEDKAILYENYAKMGLGWSSASMPAWEPKDRFGNARQPNFDIGMHDHPVSLINETM